MSQSIVNFPVPASSLAVTVNDLTVNGVQLSQSGDTLTITDGTPPPDPTITGVSVTGAATLNEGATSQYAATVTGTGPFNPAVTWSCSDGSISTSGLFTAPLKVETVTITATSVEDPTKAGTFPVSIALPGNTVKIAPSGGVTSGTADPTGNTCTADQLYVQTTTGNLYSCDAGVFAKVGPSAGSGTVTSVSFTGGLISVATPTTTPALTVAGTSGGIPYFSSASTWASSALLATNGVVLGGGAGNPPQTVAGIVTDGVSQLNLGVNGIAAGLVNLLGTTSGNQTISTNATGTQVLFKSGAILAIPGSSSGTYTLTPNSTGSTLTTSGSFASSGTVSGGAGVFSGTVSSGGFSGVSTGAPTQVYNTAATSQSASQGATTMFANPAADRNYRFSVSIGQLAAGTTCTIAGSVAVNLIFTDSITGNILTYIVPLDVSGGTALGANIPLSTSAPNSCKLWLW